MTIMRRFPGIVVALAFFALLMLAAFASVAKGDTGPQFFGQTESHLTIAVGEQTTLAAGYTLPSGTAFTLQTFQATEPGTYNVTVQLGSARPATYTIDVR